MGNDKSFENLQEEPHDLASPCKIAEQDQYNNLKGDVKCKQVMDFPREF